MRGFRDSIATRRSHDLTLAIYHATRSFPGEERYGLSSQLRRAASSIGGNLAEGIGRMGKPEFARHVSIASGSCQEVAYFLLLSRDLGYLSDDAYQTLSKQADELGRILTTLRRRLKE